MKWRKIETVCIVAVLVLLFLLTGRLYQSETDTSTFCSLNSGWYQIKDGKKIHVELPCYVVTDANGKIVLYNDILSEKDQGKFISSKGVQDHLEIDLGDGILYQYKKHKFQKNKQMKGKMWAEICLPEGTERKRSVLCLRVKKIVPFIYRLRLWGVFRRLSKVIYRSLSFPF